MSNIKITVTNPFKPKEINKEKNLYDAIKELQEEYEKQYKIQLKNKLT